MNGAESLARTLAGAGVEVCFANPGTSEMHFVAALDRVGGLRCVLGLFEGVVTGAADGYGRMAEKPASTLLHLGPGLANGLANVHNARRADTPMVNVVGDHATYHKRYDAPLASDVEGVARPFSHWVRTSTDSRSVAGDGAAAVAAALAPPGRISTLILPADVSWNEADGPAPLPPVEERAAAAPEAIAAAARALRSDEPTVLFLSGPALREPGLTLAGRIAASTGARLVAQTLNARTERGAGRVAVEFLPYPVDEALSALAGTSRLLLVGSKAPVAFFAYPGKPSELRPEGCEVITVATPAEDVAGALEALADELGATQRAPVQALETPPQGGGPLSFGTAAAVVAALLPEDAVVVDEALTGAAAFISGTRGAAPHDYLQVTGGAIGIGPPLATGAAIACPDRKVVCLQADGSAMYTVQALWTQAREGLDVTTVILDNRSYAILKGELANVGAGDAGRKAHDMMELDRPALDWVALARGMGVEAGRATTAEEFDRQLEAGLRSEGPYLIDLVL
ncbi:MAG: Thiamine pyrophosphate-requiring enzymes [uncultured Rubrobacteraceae bacterium]|uniref:Thiamine pyrophosphate-requiring enzymes n=1 Tax=uncultured Rubrobacteraceae bacterium TaxID=349277 RepID=A0A6J4TCJ3_9ACTN|nr:MAG: Thiamine pyrophosphate-requiring enzymes [uncultured Rubrobacteraceae bacterium]